jgi:glycosyltransferase involved in cell wall biosynthesis
MKKINLFVFAAHHLAGNIAAQRFRSLLKYLDPAKYRIFVFARESPSAMTATVAPPDTDITLFSLPGRCVGSESSAAASLLALAAAFVRPLPFLLAGGRSRARPWLVHALAEADRLCADKLAAGERCAVIGTYSPVDALIAAAALSSRHHIACLQDFRDGLVFEPLGKPGRLRKTMRQLIEARVVAASDLVTSVSGPLVDDFRQRYPHKSVTILPNGYDPADFAALDGDVVGSTRAAALLAREVSADALLVGHFGRIGASDGSASTSLGYLVDALNDSIETDANRHLVFVGELTAGEEATLRRARFPVSVCGPVERALALQLMRRCDKLLLLTGSRASCATGKLFEYLAAGADIVCISGVSNEATAILARTGAGQTILTGAGAAGYDAVRSALSPRHGGARHDIAAYSRVAQADRLDSWLSAMVQP